MALFAKFKNAKNAAVEHKKTAAAQQAKPPAAPYKHVPTHAAQDALAAQPITLKPEELQARIAKARKRRASSYQSPVAARHSVYHSCESSRMSSRTNSTAHFALASHPSSIKGQSSSGGSIDAVMRRSQSVPQQQGTSNSELRREDYLLPGFAGHSPFSSPGTQRPRPSQNMSSRSSFAKKKSPLSSVSSEDESGELHSSSSDTSASSTQISDSHKSHFGHGKSKAITGHTAATAVSHKDSATIANTGSTAIPSTSRRSRWSILPRKNAAIVAH